MRIQMNNAQFKEMMTGVFETLEKHKKEIAQLKAQNTPIGIPVATRVYGGRRTRRIRRKKRTRRRGKSRRKRGAVRTKHNTPKVFDPKTMKVIPNPHFKKPKKPSPITLSVQGQRVTFHPREVEQQRKMLTQLKKLSPQSSSKAFQLGSFNPQSNKGGRRKKGTRRRGKKGGHAGNTSSSGRQYNYTELAAMREANPQRVYYLYIINTNSEPPLVAPVGNGFTHEFKLNTNGDKIAITGHRVGHHNQNPAYTIPNPANNNIPPAIEVANNFYNPAPGVSREFRDISDIMGNLQMGGSGIKSTIEGNSCDFLPHHKLCKGGGRKKRRKSRGKSRRRMRRKRKRKTKRKRRR